MAIQVQLRRGTTAEHAAFTGADGELTYNTDTDAPVAHDGATAGGKPLATRAYVDTEIITVSDGTDMGRHGADLASASTVNLDAATGDLVDITGTTTITALTLAEGRSRVCRFTGALTLTHGASLVMPGAANITTAAGDFAVFRGYAAGVVRCVAYTKLSGASVFTASTTEALTGTDTAKAMTADAAAALWEKGSDVASAGTISLGEGRVFHITGTTTITDIDFATAKDGRAAWLIFDGALTLTHNATTLKLPGGASIVTAANDRALVIQDASDNVIVAAYVKADGRAIIAKADATDTQSGPIEIAIQSEMETATDTVRAVVPGRQQFHPSAAKAWLSADASGGINASYNITSIADTGTGILGVTIAQDFSSSSYVITTSARTGGSVVCCISAQAAGTCSISAYRTSTDAPIDPIGYQVAMFGDQ